MNNFNETIKKEIDKIIKNPVYFILWYIFIQHPVDGKIRFRLYDFQKQVLKDFFNFSKNVILKSRQLGISTLSAAYSLWLAMFFANKNILVVATNQRVARNLVDKVKYAYDNLPEWLKRLKPVTTYNKLGIEFENGSKIHAESSGPDSGRSESLSLLIIDEAAFISSIDRLWAAVQQTLATGGKAIILSTPNGVGNFFHRLWINAKAGLNSFNTIKLHWSVHPERDQAWRDQQTKELGEKLAAQECDVDFTSSGDTVLNAKLIKQIRDDPEQVWEPQEKRGRKSELWIFKYPLEGRTYLISADVARGDGSDYSAFHILDVETLEQVAEFKGKIGTNAFANLLCEMGYRYNQATIVVENASMGWSTVERVEENNYPNLFYSKVGADKMTKKEYLNKSMHTENKKLVPGFSNTSKTRPLIINHMQELFDNEELIIHSERLLDELSVFIWLNKKPQAHPGYNDDLVMSYAIGLYVRDEYLQLDQFGLSQDKSMISGMKKSKNSRNPAGFKMNKFKSDPWKMDIGYNEQIDLSEFL